MNVYSQYMKRRAAKTRTAIRQEQIAQAALALVARDGLKTLNIASLAKEVGVVPSAIYRHYRGKDAVLEVVLDLISQRLLENVEVVRRETPDPLERLHRLLERHVQLVEWLAPVLCQPDLQDRHAFRQRHLQRL